MPGVGGSYWIDVLPGDAGAGDGNGDQRRAADDDGDELRRQRHAGVASGINNAVSRVAALLAIALFGLVMAALFDRSLHSELTRAQLSPQVIDTVERQKTRLAAIELPPSLDARDAAAATNAVQHAFVAGFRWVMLVSAALSLASAVVAWLTIGSAPSRDAAVPRF